MDKAPPSSTPPEADEMDGREDSSNTENVSETDQLLSSVTCVNREDPQRTVGAVESASGSDGADAGPSSIRSAWHRRKSMTYCATCGELVLRENPTHALYCTPPEDLARLPAHLRDKFEVGLLKKDDIPAVMSQTWRDEAVIIVPTTILTMLNYAPNSFFIIREKTKVGRKGVLCAAACVLVFETEVAFCGFFQLIGGPDSYALSRLLWNHIVGYSRGKNIFTVMARDLCVNFLRKYPFHLSPRGSILYGLVMFDVTPAVFTSTVPVVDYVDSYFDRLVRYDSSVFGFRRLLYLRYALKEEGLIVKVATTNAGDPCGYAGVQREQRGCPVLRWLLANDVDTAEALMCQVLDCDRTVRKVGIVAALYWCSPITQAIIRKMDISLLEPWALVYNRREPVYDPEKIISLTFI